MYSPELTSLQNPTVVGVGRLHDAKHRRREGLTLIEGPHFLADALGSGADLVAVYCLEEPEFRLPVTPVFVSEPVLKKLAGTASPRGPVAVVRIPDPRALTAHNTVVLSDVADPGNVGAIIRSAGAFGWKVAVTGATADPWGPKTIRAAAGSQFRTGISVLGNAGDDLTAAGLTSVVSLVTGGVRPESIDSGPFALWIGSEAHGLSEAQIAGHPAVSIDLVEGVESLNAAVAAGVLMYAMRGDG